jgi:hypothetical protein
LEGEPDWVKVHTEILSARHVVVSLGTEVSVLFSYRTAVAARVGKSWYRTTMKYGPTTGKHVAGWLEKADCDRVRLVEPDFLAELLPLHVAGALGWSEHRAREHFRTLRDHI